MRKTRKGECVVLGYRYTIKDLPPQERPRERLIERGAEVLSTAELLAVVLGSGSEGESALDLAYRLLNRAGGSLAGLGALSVPELLEIRGMGVAKAARWRATVELAQRLWAAESGHQQRVTSPADLARLLMQRMRYLDREHLLVVMLDARHHVLGTETVSVGDLTSAPGHPREVFKSCIRRSAAAVVLVHNHPSGDPAPSEDDVALTVRLQEAGRLLGIEVLDHIILAGSRYLSLREAGIAWEKGA